MTKVLAKNVTQGMILIIGGEEMKVEEVEHSAIAKQGTKKTRIVARTKTGEAVTIIRPADYPLEKHS